MLGRLFRYLLGSVAVLVVLGVGISLYALTEMNRPAGDANSPQQVFVIDPGEGVPSVATRLEQDKLVRSSFLFRVMLKLRNAEDQIKAGDFQLAASMTPEQILGSITVVPAESSGRVTIPEGYRIEQIADLLADEGLVDRDVFLQQVVSGQFNYDWVPQDRKTVGDLEGFLFPDTYDFPRHGTDREARILDMMVKNFGERVDSNLRAEATAGQWSLRDILTVASIVEREAQVDDERPIIAGVFFNRLAQGMKLDADPTTQYALGEAGNWWPQLHLDPNTVDNPYNTYVYTGMPPGPIVNPGLASIKAATRPTQHEFFYFVACGGGRHVFAATLEEHERNIARCQ